MAFNTNPGRQSFTAAAAQTDFTFNFKIYEETDIKVYLTPVGNDPDDAADLLTYGSEYTVSIDGDNGGAVTLLSGATLNDTLVFERELPRTRTTSYVTNGDLKAATLNLDQDYQTYLLIDDFNTADRSLSLPSTDVTMSPELPSTQVGQYLKVKSDGTGFEYSDLSGSIFEDLKTINTIDDFSTIDVNLFTVAVVKDINRGGVFIYDASKSAINNGGTIINGWVRQYSGAINVKWFGAAGDGVNDDTDAFRLFKDVIESNNDYIIPSGTYNVTISPSDITAVTDEDRDFAFILIDNKSNITISGDGVIIFNAQSTSERAWFIIARDCGNITIDKFKLIGTLDFIYEEVSQNMNEYGVMFYNSTGSKLTNSFMRQVVVPVSVTGEPTSPATTANLTVNTIISNNLFKLFMQNSTFGAGAEGLIVESNIFEDMYTGFKISRNPLDDSSTIDISKNYIFNANVFKWNSSFNFGAVDYQPTSAWSLVGIELQAPSNNVIITNNVIDMGKIQANTKPMITETSPIILFNNNLISDENYKPKKVSILNNTIIGYKHVTRYGIYGSSLIDELKISNNTIEGGIRIASAIYSYYSSSTIITDNLIKTNDTLPAGIFIDDLKTQQLNISNNSLQGISGITLTGYSSFILFADCEATKVAIKNNIMDLGGIYSSSSTLLTCTELSIIGNVASEVNINTNTAKNITVSDNRLRTNGTAVKLVLDATTKASCLVSVINNATYGVTTDGVATILNLNGGKLKVSNNGFTSSTSQFILDSTVTIYEGHYFGSGVPTQNAFMGVRYTNYNTGSDGNYIKNSFTTNTGWVKIATV